MNLVKKVVDNFYLRNLFILSVLVSVYASTRMRSGPVSLSDFGVMWLFAGWTYLSFVFHNLVLYKMFLQRRKPVQYAVGFFLFLYVYKYGYDKMTYQFTGITVHHSLIQTIGTYWINIAYCYLALGAYLAFSYSKDRELLLKAENEKKELEIKQLNAQLNPHFLFNALNNIYSYLLLESDNGKELILKLSELMRYIVGSSKKDKVPVLSEVMFIGHYISFERERLGHRCEVEYRQDINDGSGNIVPLILFNFIENAFKHGTHKIKPSNIVIRICADQNSLQLYVSNNVHKEQMNSSTQTGLNNAEKRLKLLYPGKHNLKITRLEDRYTVSLKIDDLS